MESAEEFVEDFLEHHGVKGMKWGVRKDRSELRRLNKESRRKDREKFNKDIDKARARVGSGKAKVRLKKAKADYKSNKYEIGSREARKILNKERERYYDDLEVAQYAKAGKERAIAATLTGISVATIIAMQMAQNR